MLHRTSGLSCPGEGGTDRSNPPPSSKESGANYHDLVDRDSNSLCDEDLSVLSPGVEAAAVRVATKYGG
jgi:hypothetical protein